MTYEVIRTDGRVPVKAWTRGVPFEEEAKKQLANLSKLPIVHKWIAVMPDVHFGIGATVGSVVPTKGAIIPAAVGVDIGCGMCAVRTSLAASDLPTNLRGIREALERAIPHGGGKGDVGNWPTRPARVRTEWGKIDTRYRAVIEKHPKAAAKHGADQLGTLGGGNHFVELCLDEEDRVWLMLHSGSRGVGNRIGQYFIELAKRDMATHAKDLPDRDLAYLSEGTKHFDDYVEAVGWAQDFARINRAVMLERGLDALRETKGIPPFEARREAVNCHHNYVVKEHHYGEDVWVTRKGAVRAGTNEMGIIPGSMGAKSFIVRGKGNEESFLSCSHGAGRVMSRGEAKRRFTIEDHRAATQGVECRKDADVIDETPAAYKSIDAVMQAQDDLVEIVHTLKQVVCVKG
jgi:tRNA-splicing ligase RtcB